MRTSFLVLIAITALANAVKSQIFYMSGGDYILPKNDSIAIYRYPCEQNNILKYLFESDSIKYDGSFYECTNSINRVLEIVINQEPAYIIPNDAIIHYKRDTITKKDIVELLSEDSLRFMPDEYFTFERRLNDFIDRYRLVGDINAISNVFSKFYKIPNPFEKLNILKKNNIPLFLSKVELTSNIIGNPEVTVTLKNISQNDIDAYDINIYCYDRYGQPVKRYATSSNLFIGTSQDVINSGEESTDTWTLYGQELTTNVKVFLSKVHLTNGKTLVIANKQLTKVEGKLD